MQKLNWPLITILASTGFLFAGATIMAWINGMEHWIVLIMIVGVGKMAAFFELQAPIRNAFVAGFLMALVAVWTQGVFLTTYFENNPEYKSVAIPFGLTPRSWTFLSAPVGATIAGALSGLTALLFRVFFNVFRRKRRDNV